MRRLSILKAIAHFVFIMAVIALIFVIPAFVMLVVMPGTIPFKINGEIAENAGPELLLLLFILIVGAAFFVYALYLFRKVLELFSKRKIFDTAVIKLFDQIGKALIIGCLITVVPSFLYNVIAEGKPDFELSFSFYSALFVIGLGLFFMVLSDVFLIAKTMKEENDLTV